MPIMKTFIFQTSLILGALAAGTTGLLADESAFQASLTPDIAIHPRTTQINGLALNIWGENPQSSLNLGFVNGSTGDSQGLSWGLLNYADSYTGVEWAWINVSREKFYGWQDAFINISQGTFTGLQSGWINVAQEFEGLQLGLAETLDGVQIGFVNVALNNPWFTGLPDKLATGFPVVNWSF
jgi:hypothetical protein